MAWFKNKLKKNSGDSPKTEITKRAAKLSQRALKEHPLAEPPVPATQLDEERSYLACADDYPSKEMLLLACKHHFCPSCTTRMFRLAAQEELSYPPKCCKQRISLTQAHNFLDRDVRELYEKKRIEWDTKNRVYCSRKTCNTFIPKDKIDKKRATCPNCGAKTCPRCKEPEHKGDMCAENEALMATLRTITKRGWKRCPKCGQGIERKDGCNVMTCSCGCPFCYACGSALTQHFCTCAESQRFGRGMGHDPAGGFDNPLAGHDPVRGPRAGYANNPRFPAGIVNPAFTPGAAYARYTGMPIHNPAAQPWYGNYPLPGPWLPNPNMMPPDTPKLPDQARDALLAASRRGRIPPTAMNPPYQ